MKKGFDNELYVKLQTETIKKRIKMFDKLYLEFGGKLFDDYHAKRVLPGFELNAKIRLLESLKDDAEVIFCINAADIERKKIRADHGISYDLEVIRLVKALQELGISINSVVITLFKDQPSVSKFQEKLAKMNIKTYIHRPTKGYPTDIDTIVSDEGYGANPYIETTKKLVIVNAPGPCSGKLATCLSQLYHEYKRGVRAGYAKFETFPVWSLPLKHPVNVAYEAATADLKDVNMIDNFHLDAYGISAVNYNRDLEIFPVLKNILLKITGEEIYKSPTDMGVNSISKCITNDDLICDAANHEIVRRYYQALTDNKLNGADIEIANRIKLLMNELNLDETIIKERQVALDKQEKENKPVIAMTLPNGKTITGKETSLLTPASSLIINAIKVLSKIDDSIYLLSPNVLEPILKLKKQSLKENQLLTLKDVLIALSICSATNPIIEKALSNLSNLSNLNAHATYIVDGEDLSVFKKLKINLTCEPSFYDNHIV